MKKKLNAGEFIVYRRCLDPDTNELYIMPFVARLEKRYASWDKGKPVGLPTVSVKVVGVVAWSEVYGGHVGWITEQIEKIKQAIKRERVRRAARNKPAGGFQESTGTGKAVQS